MNCGLELAAPITGADLSDLLAYIGLGKLEREAPATPSTVGLDHDDDGEEDSPNAAILSYTRQLNYATCHPCSPAPDTNATQTRNAQLDVNHGRCNPQTCRMTSGICVDCTYCLDHCICENMKASKHIELSTRTKDALRTNAAGNRIGTQQRQQYVPETLRKTPSLMGSSSDGSDCQEADVVVVSRKTRSKTPSPYKTKTQSSGNSLRFNMGEVYAYNEKVKLTSQLLEDHTHRSSGSTCSHHSYHSGNSSNTGSRSRHRYNMGDNEDAHYNHRAAGSQRRNASGASISSSRSRKSNNTSSLSLMSGTKSNQGFLRPTFSFDSSASTRKRANSHAGSSLSSSSSRYLEDGSIADVEPKKSWFRRRKE